MKPCTQKLFASLFVASMLIACGDDSSSSSKQAITQKDISGVSQKGPFVKGTAVHLFELDSKTFSQTGNIFTGKIKSNKGDFTIDNINLNSPYVLFETSGYYHNEVTGKKSSGELTLNAISDLRDRNSVNINLLTHLEYERVAGIMKKKKSISEAKAQAETEILATFGISDSQDNFEDLNIFGKSDENAQLLAISILLQGNRTEAELSELLAEYANDIEKDGTWDDSSKYEVAKWALEEAQQDAFKSIRKNIEKLDYGDVPDFEKYIYNFINHVYGCQKKSIGDTLVALNGYNYVCSKDEDGAFSLIPKKSAAGDIGPWTYENGAQFNFKSGKQSTTGWWNYYASKNSDETKESSIFWPAKIGKGRDSLQAVIDSCGGICGEVIKGSYVGLTMNFSKDSTVKFNITSWEGLCVESEGDFYVEVIPIDQEKRNNFGNFSYNVSQAGIINIPWSYFEQPEWGLPSILSDNLKIITGIKFRFESDGKFNIKAVGPMGTCGKETTKPQEPGETIPDDSHYGEGNGEYDEGNGDYEDGNGDEIEELPIKKYACEENFKQLDLEEESFICFNGNWYNAEQIPWKLEKDDYLNSKKTYGTLKDSRDNHTYATIDIGPYTWMAQNLNYADSTTTNNLLQNTACPYGLDINCEIVGRQYTWTAAMDISQIYQEKKASSVIKEHHQGICPEGWWLPDTAAYNILNKIYSGSQDELRAKGFESWPNATNESGFSALYVDGYDFGSWDNNNDRAEFWTSSEHYEPSEKTWGAYAEEISDDKLDINYSFGYGYNVKNFKFAVRCLKFNETCNSSYQNQVKEYGDIYTICDKGIWRIANDAEADINGRSCTKNYEQIKGAIDGSNTYTCYEGKWYNTEDFPWTKDAEEYLNSSVTYGTLEDSRDGQKYATVNVGPYTWMAQNLNYADSATTTNLKYNTECFHNIEENCKFGGRLYTWTAAMNIKSTYQEKSAVNLLQKHNQGICPDGWWIPDTLELSMLIDAAGGRNQLYSQSTTSGEEYESSDAIGFSFTDAGGAIWINSDYFKKSTEASMWLSCESQEEPKNYAATLPWHSYDKYTNTNKSAGLSLRCVTENTTCDETNNKTIIHSGNAEFTCINGQWSTTYIEPAEI